jgi:hypothetical protein
MAPDLPRDVPPITGITAMKKGQEELLCHMKMINGIYFQSKSRSNNKIQATVVMVEINFGNQLPGFKLSS